jgi:hypothetical protein
MLVIPTSVVGYEFPTGRVKYIFRIPLKTIDKEFRYGRIYVGYKY